MTSEQRAKRIKKLYQIFQRQLREAGRGNISIEFEHRNWSRNIPYWELGDIYISKNLGDK